MSTDIALHQPPFEIASQVPQWPRGLQRLDRPPSRLRVAGALPGLTRAVAIVGTRRCDPEAKRFAQTLARDLAASRCPVVSGGAHGIDSAAHHGALEAGGPTIAVLASGLRRAYPPRNRALFERIATLGALVTEHDDDCPPRRGRFLERNRIIAALSRAVVVVQAPHRSGALSTAAVARELGIPVFAVPASPWDVRGAGCARLLAGGALPCAGASDIARALNFGPIRRFAEGPRSPMSSMEATHTRRQRTILAALSSVSRHVDELAGSLGLPAAEVQTALLELLLLGDVQDRGGGYYVRRTR